MNREWNRLRFAVLGYVVFPAFALFCAWLVA